MTFLIRIRHAWAVLMGRTQRIETDAEAELRQLHARILFAVRYLKDIPMIADDINALGTAITAALAEKDTLAAQTVQELATAKATIDTLQAELANADQQVLALKATLTPTAPVQG